MHKLLLESFRLVPLSEDQFVMLLQHCAQQSVPKGGHKREQGAREGGKRRTGNKRAEKKIDTLQISSEHAHVQCSALDATSSHLLSSISISYLRHVLRNLPYKRNRRAKHWSPHFLSTHYSKIKIK